MNTSVLTNPSLIHSSALTISNTTASIHHHADEILYEAKKVSKRLGVILDDFYNDHTTMTNYLYVDASIERMVHAVVTYDVLYYIDDLFGEDTKSETSLDFMQILSAWKGKSVSMQMKTEKEQKLYKAIEYIGAIIRDNAPASFFERYTASVVTHLNAALIDQNFSSVEEYIQIRRHTGGMEPVMDLIEFTHDLYLTESIYNALPKLRDLKESCVLMGVLSNDLFSYAKERHSNYNLINAYLVTNEADNFQDAVQQSIECVNQIHIDYLSALEACKTDLAKLSQDETALMTRYLKAIEVLFASCYHWQKSTSRYVHDLNIFSDMRPDTFYQS